MNKRLVIFYGVFSLSLVFLVFALTMRHRPEPAPVGDVKESGARSVEKPAATETSEREERKPAMPREADIEITEADRTTFLASPVAEKWMADFGYTPGDIVRAQRTLREQNARDINDPNAIMHILPPRHIASLSITGLDVPSEATAGQPIPFTLRGTPPSPSFIFTRFDILVQAPVIRIRAFGHSKGETASGPGDVVERKGRIDPLPAGEYRIEVAELGPAGSFPLVVRP